MFWGLKKAVAKTIYLYFSNNTKGWGANFTTNNRASRALVHDDTFFCHDKCTGLRHLTSGLKAFKGMRRPVIGCNHGNVASLVA